MADLPLSTAYSISKLNNTTIDRISNLPDALLCHILSFLPTINAVATSILSTRWKYLWTSVPTIDVVEGAILYKQMSLVHIVYRVLLFRNNASCIKKLRLIWKWDCDSIHLDMWVCAAITRGLEELDLCLCYDGPAKLPRSLFTCKKLKVLKLKGRIRIDVPSSVCFPSLKILHLNSLSYLNEASFGSLLYGCPVLEKLIIEGFGRNDNMRTFNISAPALKSLTILRVVPYPKYNIHKFEMNTPALESLDIQYYVGVAFSIEKASSLVRAKVDVRVEEPYDEYYSNGAFELLRGLCNVKFLSLSGNIRKVMKPLKNDDSYDLPMFYNLTRLEIAIGCCDWYLLPNFLESSHNLEVLSLEKNVFHSSPHECRTLQPMPKCLSPHLATITISGFQGLGGELKLVTYILENAKVLKTMNIICHYMKLKKIPAGILKKISTFPRASETCQVTFY